MDVKSWGPIAAFLALLASGAAAAQSIPAEVTLPLKDYLALVETVERTERQRAEELARQETPVAEVTSQQVSLTVGDKEAEVASDFEVLLQGKILRPVLLPLAGFPEKVEIRDEVGRTGTAAVTAIDGGGGVVLAAPQPGRYTVHVDGRAPLGNGAGTGRLALGRVAASVASTEIDLPADLAWASPGAVVVEEREENGRRRVRLATARGTDTVLDVRRKVDSAEAEKLLAQSVVLTILQLRPEGLRRHDVILYEVRRGGLGSFSVELPPGLEIEQAGTDEGTVVPVVETGRLTVHRRRQLQGVGYLVLSSTPPALPAGELSLEAVKPEVEVRARYLAISSAVAADVRPLPETSWNRVDLSDLPATLSEALTALDLTAAWRLTADGAGARLAVVPLPAAPIRDAIIRRRDTTALLTVDGTLLFRDRFLVDSRSRAGAALDMTLPAGGKLWSAKVDDQAVRPLERGGMISVPLGFNSGTRAVVEVVSVQARALPPGRSQLALDLPQVTAPVLVHRLRVLLPENASYRFRRGDLRLAPAETAALDNAPTARDPWTLLQSTPGILTDRINVGGNETGQAATGATVGGKENAALYKQEVEGLQQGLVGGVKPLPVSIPESGKALAFSGVLPPSHVAVELDVKAKRKS
ncbi:MAG TPA: hypothetical protein VEW48_25655 [Thermoanaerobaculia bacterium]|nr:hypothetical protein [Thermoanaerobaculia bacterium]